MQVIKVAQQTAVENILYTVGHESGYVRDLVHFLNKEDMEHYVHTVLVPLHLDDDGYNSDDITAMFAQWTKWGAYKVSVNIDGEAWTMTFKVTYTERFISYE